MDDIFEVMSRSETMSYLADNTSQLNNVVGSKYRMTFNKNQLGVNIQNPMDLSTLQYKFDLMKSIGIHNIVLLPQGNLATYTDTTITEDTISESTLETYIQSCQSAGFTVMLKCHIECKDGTWRANIAPSDPTTFFTNYQAFIVKYATLAQKYSLPIFCLGEEMKSITTSTYQSNWQSIVNAVRGVYSGKLTYGANVNGNPDEYNNGNVVYPLIDYLGVDWWCNQNPVNGTRIPNYNYLNGFLNTLVTLYNQFGKKIIFTEVGYLPTPEGANQPSNPSAQTWGSLDYNLQAQYYDIFFSNVIGQEWFQDCWYWAETNNSYSTGTSPDRYSVLVDANTATQAIFKNYMEVSL